MPSKMHYRLMLDTNILLDAVDSRRPESSEAREVLKRCNKTGDMGFVAPSSLNDFFYIKSKEVGKENARKLLGFILDLVMVVPVSAEECLMSLTSNEKDYEDGVIRACSELNGIDLILTRDRKAYAGSTIRALSCSEFLSKVAKEEDEFDYAR